MNLGWGTNPRSCCHTSLQKAKVTCTFCEIFLPNQCGQSCQDAYKERRCAFPNWHNTKMYVNQSLLGKGRILIISHYSGTPCQLAEPNPGTFSSSLHPWDAARWKQWDSPGFRTHSDVQFTPVLPDVLWAPSLHKPGARACKPEGRQGQGGRWTGVAGVKIFKIRAENQGLTEDVPYQKKILHIQNVLWKRSLLYCSNIQKLKTLVSQNDG